MNDDLTEMSKYVSYVLRHRPDAAGIKLDKNGWTNLDQLLVACQKQGYPLDKPTLMAIVEQNNKKRFTISEDGLNIRAAQGHSTKEVQLEMKTSTPPAVLYHGTAVKFVESIKKKGLISKSRHHVHLSADTETATSVGSRHGDPVIFEVNTKAMLADGHKFYLSDNHVWLTDVVPKKYIKLLPGLHYDNSMSLSS